ncbi:sugar phosphate nucleotidyltransferase [Kordiimonas marina]|uniref:sugar phosphate nucleotidyltransferase n=1 Tax=Kordiimonas marina TaxID=2872312 RepID=UPI001FF47332|nr:sugar phosphate nucleotidyltransferase [Kordiimonas marina]MCJ9429966.1 NTP transferase domain-containing protein [Kordiimonas marina]
MTAIVLAGGKGTRIAHLVNVPKPLVPVCGEPFLHWITKWVMAQGETSIVYSAGFKAHEIEAWVDAEQSRLPGCTLKTVVETSPLGTGGGALLCADAVEDDHYLIVNGDSLTDLSLEAAYGWLERDATLDGVMVGVVVEDASRYGSLAYGDDNILTGFREKTPGKGVVNAGTYLLRKHMFDGFTPGESYSMETDFFPTWLSDGRRIGIVMTAQQFIDIGTPDTFRQADTFVRAVYGASN